MRVRTLVYIYSIKLFVSVILYVRYFFNNIQQGLAIFVFAVVLAKILG